MSPNPNTDTLSIRFYSKQSGAGADVDVHANGHSQGVADLLIDIKVSIYGQKFRRA